MTLANPRRDASSESGVLFISYTGLLEPLGQSQVLAYQELLAADRPVHIVSFERGQDLRDVTRMEAMRTRIMRAGIDWHPLRYHKRFSLLATCWDILVGIWTGWRLLRRHGVRIVHARSYVAGLMGLALKRLTGVRFLFDMRGFWVDERIDGGLWPQRGALYRSGKWVERRLLQGADHVVSLTHAAVAEMQSFGYLQGRMPPMTVIPTCADLSRFVPLHGKRSGDQFTLGYVGAAGTWYLFDATVAAFRELLVLRPASRFLIVNRNEHALIRHKLATGGIDVSRVDLVRAEHEEIPGLMGRMDATAFFIKPVFSKQASAPTKLGEFLGCGVPVLANTGVGDMARILRDDRVGVAIASVDRTSIRAGVEELLELCADADARRRCVESAARHFSLHTGVARYRQVYMELLSEGPVHAL